LGSFFLRAYIIIGELVVAGFPSARVGGDTGAVLHVTDSSRGCPQGRRFLPGSVLFPEAAAVLCGVLVPGGRGPLLGAPWRPGGGAALRARDDPSFHQCALRSRELGLGSGHCRLSQSMQSLRWVHVQDSPSSSCTDRAASTAVGLQGGNV